MSKKKLKNHRRDHPEKVPSTDTPIHKRAVSREGSTDHQFQLWSFSKRDRDGKFRFDSARDDFNHRNVLERIIEYTSRTWAEIKAETHDRFGKTCHHFLSPESLSKEAVGRISAMRLEEYADSLFSMRMNNKLRVIGYREGSVFYAIWYDPNHEFCHPSR